MRQIPSYIGVLVWHRSKCIPISNKLIREVRFIPHFVHITSVGSISCFWKRYDVHFVWNSCRRVHEYFGEKKVYFMYLPSGN